MRSLVSTSTIDDAEVILGSIRRSVLVALQSAEANGNLLSIRDEIEELSLLFAESNDPRITASVDKITSFYTNGSLDERGMLAILDEISAIESALIGNGLVDGEASERLLEAIDDSFREFDRVSRNGDSANGQRLDAIAIADDEIDIELLEVFAEEANQLISDLEMNVDRLATPGEEANALWEIRRIAHTFKGAAGAVGLDDATRIAHRIEDVIAFVEASNTNIKTRFQAVLKNAIGLLRDITDFSQRNSQDRIDVIFEEFDKLTTDPQTSNEIAGSGTAPSPTNKVERQDDTTPRTKKPVVRVSLAVLDSIEARMRQLVDSLSEMQTGIGPSLDKQTDPEFARQFENQRILAMSIDEELRAIRLVEFATLTTRLQRAVRVACEEEHKTAEILIENGELRIDTVLLDSLVEPLMHLLRNCVVHGLERTETRRLIGKAESGLVRIKLSEGREGIEIVIEDDGRGIDVNSLKSRAVGMNVITEDDAATLTDADALELIFHQGLSTANNLTLLAGRGVGMSIVREAITSIGGTIAVESKTNLGTTFRIFIPARRSEEATSELTDRSRKVKVLTVDDSASVRKLNCAVIEKCGCTPIAAEGVREAMKLLAEDHTKPDLILTDLEMPVIDGFEFITWLKNQLGLLSIPVVVVSTKDEPEIVTEALRLGAEACLTKPLDTSKLEIALREFVRSN